MVRSNGALLALAAALLLSGSGCGLVLGIEDLSGDGGGTSSGTTSGTSSSVCPCGAGQCAGGKCQKDLATDQQGAGAIVVDEAKVYWAIGYAGSGSISSVGKGGGSPAVLTSAMNPGSLAIDASSVFWNDGDTGTFFVATILKTGEGFGEIYKGSSWAGAVAVNDESVFWASDTGVMKAPKGGTVGSGTSFASGTGVTAIAADAQNVYWVDGKSGIVSQEAVSGGSTMTLNPGHSGDIIMGGIGVDSKFVYWTTSDSVLYAPIGGGDLKTLASGQNKPRYLAVSEPDVWWNADEGIWHATMGGGTAAVVVSGAMPRGLAADDLGVYWTTTDGVVRFQSKP